MFDQIPSFDSVEPWMMRLMTGLIVVGSALLYYSKLVLRRRGRKVSWLWATSDVRMLKEEIAASTSDEERRKLRWLVRGLFAVSVGMLVCFIAIVRGLSS